MRKRDYYLCENKGADQLCSNCTAYQPFVSASMIVQLLLFPNPKFQAFTLFLRLYETVLSDLMETPKTAMPIYGNGSSNIDFSGTAEPIGTQLDM